MSIRAKLILVLLVAAVGSGLVVTYTIYLLARRAIASVRLEQLESVATIQESRILEIMAAARDHVGLIASRTTMRRRLAQFNATGDEAARADIAGILADAQAPNRAIVEIAVADARGVAVVSTATARRGEVVLEPARLDETRVAFVDVTRDPGGRSTLLFTAPLRLDGVLLGFLVVWEDGTLLEDVMMDYTGLGETGEMTLARRTGPDSLQFLVPLRFDPEADRRVHTDMDARRVPIARAVLAREEAGLQDGVDYRGASVMAVTRYLEAYDWGLVVKMDRREVMAPVVRLRNLLLGVFGLLCAGVVVLATAVASSLAAPIRSLTRAAERIRQGDYNFDLPVRTDGELQTLATAFEHMARQLIADSRTLEARVHERTRQLEEEGARREAVTRTLREANQFLDSVLENIPDMVFVKDAKDLRFVRFNRAGEELLGYLREQLIGKNDYDFFPKDEADFFTGKDRDVLRGTGVVEIPEEPIATRDKGVRHLHTKKIPIRDEAGRPLYLLGISEDITDKKQAKEELVRRMREVEKLNVEMAALLDNLQASNRSLETTASALREANEELESFSYSVSHDLRTPLRGIHGYAQILVDDYGSALDDEARRYLQRIQEGAKNMARLIDDLLLYARVGRQAVQAAALDMDSLVRALLQELGAETTGRNVSVTVHPLPRAIADGVLVRQVWLNLLSNAFKFTRPVAEARVDVGGRVENGQAVYYVKDNGVGFDMRYIDKVFAIFQRVHAPAEFEGTGVGLAIVQRVVKRHGGRVWAEARVGEGATFFFALPAAQERST